MKKETRTALINQRIYYGPLDGLRWIAISRAESFTIKRERELVRDSNNQLAPAAGATVRDYVMGFDNRAKPVAVH